MTQPSNKPSSATIGGIKLTVPSGSSSGGSSADLYGLGAWGPKPVTVGDLPGFGGAVLGTNGTLTGDNLIKTFASSDPTSIANIQRALYLGGYYSKTYQPSYGVVKPEDITALGNAVTVAGQSQQPLSDVLLSAAKVGVSAGVAAAQQQATAAKQSVQQVSLPNTQDLEAEAMQAFQTALGRKPKPSEAAAFAASYRAMSAGIQRAGNQAVYDATTGPGAAGLTVGQVGKDQAQIANLGDSVAEQIGPQAAHGIGSGATGDQELNQAPSFSDQLQGLGSVASEVQQQALPPNQGAGGLTQVDTETPESPAVAAENFARNENPNRAAAKDTANVFDTFLSLISSNLGGG